MKILILSHGSFAKGIYEAAQMIAGRQKNMEYLCLDEKGLENFSQKLEKYMEANQSETIYFLFDLKYGTPYNQTVIKLMKYKEIKYKLITGVNLPLVLSFCIDSYTEKNNLAKVITQAKKSIELQS